MAIDLHFAPGRASTPQEPSRMTVSPTSRSGPSAASPADLDAAAAGWLVRRQDGLDPAEESDFQAWLAAASSHRAAFERLEGVWARLGSLPDEQVAALRLGLPPAARPSIERPGRTKPFHFGRLVPLAASACVALVVAGGWVGWDYRQRQPVYSETFATTRGQRLDVQLPDGSQLQLDTATRAVVTLYRQRREVRLPEGQAMFTVQHDAGRPFDVLAGPLRISVIGTRFSVRNTGAGLGADGVRVTVEEGRVRVASTGSGAGASAGPVLLVAGEAIAAGKEGDMHKPVDGAPINAMLWREGRVNFENTPLVRALAEFERYGPTRLTLRDPEVGALRINGSYDLRQIGAFTKALPQVLPVQLLSHEGSTEIVRR